VTRSYVFSARRVNPESQGKCLRMCEAPPAPNAKPFSTPTKNAHSCAPLPPAHLPPTSSNPAPHAIPAASGGPPRRLAGVGRFSDKKPGCTPRDQFDIRQYGASSAETARTATLSHSVHFCTMSLDLPEKNAPLLCAPPLAQPRRTLHLAPLASLDLHPPCGFSRIQMSLAPCFSRVTPAANHPTAGLQPASHMHNPIEFCTSRPVSRPVSPRESPRPLTFDF